MCCMYRYILSAAALQKALQRSECIKKCCCCRENHFFPAAAQQSLQQQIDRCSITTKAAAVQQLLLQQQQYNNNSNTTTTTTTQQQLQFWWRALFPPLILVWAESLVGDRSRLVGLVDLSRPLLCEVPSRLFRWEARGNESTKSEERLIVKVVVVG